MRPLHVLHTWSFPSAYDDLVMSRTEEAEWLARTERRDHRGPGPPRPTRSPTSRCGSTPGTPGAAEALVEASRSSQLVVVGRHDPVMPVGSHVGPVARSLLHASACPVLLVDSHPD